MKKIHPQVLQMESLPSNLEEVQSHKGILVKNLQSCKQKQLSNDFFTSQYCHHIFSNFLKNSQFYDNPVIFECATFFDKSLIQSNFPWEYVFKKSMKNLKIY